MDSHLRFGIKVVLRNIDSLLAELAADARVPIVSEDVKDALKSLRITVLCDCSGRVRMEWVNYSVRRRFA